MDKKQLDFILQGGEGFKIEFKEGLSNLDKELVAFANAEGGRIFLGISDDNKIKGIKIDNIQNAINYVKKHINTEFKIKKLQREEIQQYPEEAIREAIVNAVMHRDYLDDSEDILIEIFRNKIEISNPGGLVKGFNPDEFGKKSRTRNPLIANLLLRADYVEKLGTGINRIKNSIKEAGLPEPVFKYNSSFFVGLYDKYYEKVGEKVGENENKILNLIKKNKHVTYIQISEMMGMSEKSVYLNVEKLKQKGLIKRIGPDKGGYWKAL